MLGYLSADIICSEWRTVFRERSSRKTLSEHCELQGTDNVQGQISKHVFAPNGGYCLFILQIFYAMRAVLKIREYPWIFSSFSWGIFTHVMRLDQSRVSENIRWIIRADNNQLGLRPRWLYIYQLISGASSKNNC